MFNVLLFLFLFGAGCMCLSQGPEVGGRGVPYTTFCLVSLLLNLDLTRICQLASHALNPGYSPVSTHLSAAVSVREGPLPGFGWALESELRASCLHRNPAPEALLTAQPPLQPH